MRSKKLLTTLLAGSILLGGLSACSNTAAPSKLKNVADPKQKAIDVEQIRILEEMLAESEKKV